MKLALGVAVLLAVLGGLAHVHEAPAAPAIDRTLAQRALGWSRREVTQALVAAPARAPAPPPPELALRVSNPVYISLYGPDARGRQQPAVGSWSPDEREPELSLAEAVVRASRAAALVLRTRGIRSSAGVQIKLDVAGPSVAAWSRAAPYLRWGLSRGLDGLVAEREDRRAVLLPARSAELEGELPDHVRSLEASIGGRAARLRRFRATSFVERGERGSPAEAVVRGNVPVDEVEARGVRRALREAGRYLTRMVGADGRYCYVYLAREDRCSNHYNLLRHAGTTYSLFQLYAFAREPAMLEAAERATGWLRGQVRPVPGDPSRAFLVEGDRAKLGAVGLTLIALVERERVVGDGRDRELLRRLAAFALSQQRADGYFASYFGFSPDVPVPRDNSIYYPGEAVLGLVRLHALEPDPRWHEGALRGARFLVERRWRWAGIDFYVPPDAWLTQALAELDAVQPSDQLREYAYAIVRVMDGVIVREEDGAPPDLAGGPAAGPFMPEVTPAGGWNEAMTCAWAMARRRGEADEERWLRGAALRVARFQLSHQLRREVGYFLPNPGRASGGFRDPLEDDVRIDAVQHNATALLGVLDILAAEAG